MLKPKNSLINLVLGLSLCATFAAFTPGAYAQVEEDSGVLPMPKSTAPDVLPQASQANPENSGLFMQNMEDTPLLNQIRRIDKARGWPSPSEAINQFQKYNLSQDQAEELAKLKTLEDQSKTDLLEASNKTFEDAQTVLEKSPDRFEMYTALAKQYSDLSTRYALSEHLLRQKTAQLLGLTE